MAEEGEELKGYYERKIRNLEEALERALQETERERSAREEATRYIYALLKQMGGHTIVRVEELQQQEGQLMCRVNRAAGLPSWAQNGCKLGIPGMGTAKQLIKEYYLGGGENAGV